MFRFVMRTLLVALAFGAICGAANAAPLKLNVTQVSKDDANEWMIKQIRCIRDTIYTEARGEKTYYAKFMVGYVLVNRTKVDPRQWGDSPCKAAYQIKLTKNGELVSQFSGPVHHSVELRDDDPALEEISQIAIRIYLGYEKPKPKDACAISYQNAKTAAKSRQGHFKTLHNIGKVGAHTYYCLPPIRTAVK